MISSGEVWVAVYPASGAQTPFISRPQAPSIKPFQTNPQPTRHQGAIPPSAPSKSTILRFWKNNLNHLPWVCFVVLIHTLLHFWNNSFLNARKLFLTTKKNSPGGSFQSAFCPFEQTAISRSAGLADSAGAGSKTNWKQDGPRLAEGSTCQCINWQSSIIVKTIIMQSQWSMIN